MTAVWMPGTAGELVQGWIDGVHFHVTAPINRYAAATFTSNGNALRAPANRPKSARALRLFFKYAGQASQGSLTIQSQLAMGQGLGSSTADIAGACFAAAAELGIPVTPETVARIALEVEPTDGTLFPGIVAFDHRQGRWLEPLGEPPPLAVALLDCGGSVDTIAFNEVDRTGQLRANEPLAREALAGVRAGIRESDPVLIGQAATLSARAHQLILPKAGLEAVIATGSEAGAVGVCVAHSGTAVGVLFDGRRADVAAAATYLSRRIGLPMLTAWLISGGPRYEAPAGWHSARNQHHGAASPR